MRRRPGGVVLVAVLVSAVGAASVSAQTVEDVVRRYLEARGGLVRLHAVHSLRLSGTLQLPGVPEAPFTLELKRPDRMRTEFKVEGRVAVRAYDGRVAWSQSPIPGEPPRRMSPEDAAEAKAQADVDLSPLVDAAAKGFTVELAGRDRIPGGDTFRLIVRGGGAPPRTLQLDTRSHLVVRTEERRTVEGREVDFVTEVGDYRSQDGLVFPHRIELGPKGSADRQRLAIQSIEVNPPLDDSRFSMPGSPATPSGVAGAAPKRRAPAVLP
jgi:outer membrane lipoprotein-sorting protein